MCSIVMFCYLVLLQSKIKSSWVMSTINTKRCLKNVKRNEGVVMVTYSTMSCFGLSARGVQLTDHSWPSRDKEGKNLPPLSQAMGWGSRAGGGRGRGLAVYRRQPSSLLVHSFPSTSQSLCMCLVIFSSAANCLDWEILNSHSLGKVKPV